MAIWKIEFYPKSGHRHSPRDFITSLTENSKKAQIAHRLNFMRDYEIRDWPQGWTKKLDQNLFQLRAGDIRLMFCFDGRKIIITHARRKVSQKTLKRDLVRAKANCEDYFSDKEITQ